MKPVTEQMTAEQWRQQREELKAKFAQAGDNQIVTYDDARGLAYIYLAGMIPPGGAKRQLSVNGDSDIILDFDSEGHLIGIELLRRDLLHPKLREGAILSSDSITFEELENSDKLDKQVVDHANVS